MSKMKVLFVIDNLGSGGAQNQLTLLARGLKERGHQVQVFTYYPQDFFAERLRVAEIPVHYVPKTDKVGWSVIRGLRRWVKTIQPDVVVAFLDTPNFYAALALTLANSKCRLMVAYRSMTDFSRLSRRERWRKEWVNRRADVILTNAHHERVRWQAADPGNAAKWQTLYNVVDLEAFSPGPLPIQLRRFICVGRVEVLKNPQLLIDALLVLREEGHELPVIHWYGKRDFEEPEARAFVANLDKRMDENRLNAHLQWFEPRADIGKVMTEYTALIHPSLLEGLPNVICEALAAGVPVLAGNILDHPRLVADQERGKLFDPTNAHQLAAAITWISELTETEQRQLQQNCRSYAETTFAEHHLLDQFERWLWTEKK